mgnify:CR=1 FL=1
MLFRSLGKSLEAIIQPLDITIDEFVRTCDRFTNKKLFLRDDKGNLIRDKDGNLTKVNYDNLTNQTLGANPTGRNAR